MALQVDGVAVDVRRVEPELIQVVRGYQPGNDRGRAGAEAARHRDVAADLEAQAVRAVQPLEGPDAEVVAVGGEPLLPCVHLEGFALGHLELEVDVERGGEDVVAGTQVGRGGGHPHQAPATGHGLIAST